MNRMDPTTVIKIETASASFQNVREWELCEEFRNEKRVMRWLAPVIHISPCGIVAIQKRTKPCRKEEMPKRIPRFLGDMKYKNFGVINGRVVAHDYGRAIASIRANKKGELAMRKAKWWGDD